MNILWLQTYHVQVDLSSRERGQHVRRRCVGRAEGVRLECYERRRVPRRRDIHPANDAGEIDQGPQLAPVRRFVSWLSAKQYPSPFLACIKSRPSPCRPRLELACVSRPHRSANGASFGATDVFARTPTRVPGHLETWNHKRFRLVDLADLNSCGGGHAPTTASRAHSRARRAIVLSRATCRASAQRPTSSPAPHLPPSLLRTLTMAPPQPKRNEGCPPRLLTIAGSDSGGGAGIQVSPVQELGGHLPGGVNQTKSIRRRRRGS